MITILARDLQELLTFSLETAGESQVRVSPDQGPRCPLSCGSSPVPLLL